MNDNLRYISLQYIKGKNYEKITCFEEKDKDQIEKLLKSNEEDDTVDKIEKLERILKKEKKEIGESLLDDLTNYIIFKDLKIPIQNAIEHKTKSFKSEKDEKMKIYNDNEAKRLEKKNLTKLKEELKKLVNTLKDIIKFPKKFEDIEKEDTEKEDIPKKINTLIIKIFTDLKEKYETVEGGENGEDGVNFDVNNDINEDENKKNFNVFLKKLKERLISKLKEENEKDENDENDVIKDVINIQISSLTTILTSIMKYENKKNIRDKLLLLLAVYVIYILTILEKFEKMNKEEEETNYKSSINDLEKLIKIYKKLLYICENNIKKYENIFDYNEIGNIDEVFMIESYSKFLKKLYKLKQNLESKDTKKIKRALINSLDQFFNLHGFNSPEKIESKAEIDYIVQRILNYT